MINRQPIDILNDVALIYPILKPILNLADSKYNKKLQSEINKK